MFDKESFELNEKITGKFNIDIVDGQYELNITLTRVYDWYDEAIHIACKGTVKDKILYYEIENTLEKGLYTLIKIEDNDKKIIIENDNNIICAFKIGGNDKNSIKLCNDIYLNRKNNFNRIKIVSENKDGELYNVYLFSKNILVSTIAEYDDILIIPSGFLNHTSEVEYINDFFKKNKEIDVNFKNDRFNNETYSCVFLISNIKAKNDEDALKYAIQKASVLNGVYSMILKSHGHFFAAVIFNLKESKARLDLFETIYKGNLFLFKDQGHNVLHFYKNLSNKNSYLNVYIKLLTEAIDENNRMMKYYRYWNILEGIAEHYDLEKKNILNWDGTVVMNKKGENIPIGKESLNKVYELFRQIYNNKKEVELLNNVEGLTSVKTFLIICYQRRCCCAHKGENCISDNNKCIKEREKICLRYNIIHKENSLGFQDQILRRFEEFVIDILEIEVVKEIGSPNKIDEYVNKLIG